MATAFAAPVEDGMMFALAARPARQSLPFMDPSTVSCDAVAACTYPQASGCVALGVFEVCSTRVYVTMDNLGCL